MNIYLTELRAIDRATGGLKTFWHKHCETHPIADKYGIFATTFFCNEIEVE